MARYTGPKARINRRLGTLIYETAGAARALDRRPQPPGMHVRGRRPSNYGLALMEKQKIKHSCYFCNFCTLLLRTPEALCVLPACNSRMIHNRAQKKEQHTIKSVNRWR